MILAGAAQVLACPPLQAAGATGFILGAIALLLSCICCACICRSSGNSLIHCICWLLVTLLVLAFFGTLIANTVYVADNMEFVFSNGTYIDVNTAVIVQCATPTVSLGVMIFSYMLFILFALFYICTTYTCTCVCLSQISEENNA